MEVREVLFLNVTGGPCTLRLRTGGRSLANFRCDNDGDDAPSLAFFLSLVGDPGALSQRQIKELSKEDRVLYSNCRAPKSGAVLHLLMPVLGR